MVQLPTLPSVNAVQERLQLIFPDGTSNREYVTREMAAKSVFVMLYVGAVEDSGRWIRPDQVGRMTDEQAAKDRDEDREAWLIESMGRSRGDIPGRWYSVNTREPIRDETLRDGLVAVGGVVVRQDWRRRRRRRGTLWRAGLLRCSIRALRVRSWVRLSRNGGALICRRQRLPGWPSFGGARFRRTHRFPCDCRMGRCGTWRPVRVHRSRRRCSRSSCRASWFSQV